MSPTGSGSRTRTGGSARSWPPAKRAVNHAGYERWTHADRAGNPACEQGCGQSSRSDAYPGYHVGRPPRTATSPCNRAGKNAASGEELARARGIDSRSCHDPVGSHLGLFASVDHQGRALVHSMGRARRPGGRWTDDNRRGADRPLQLAMPACRRFLDVCSSSTPGSTSPHPLPVTLPRSLSPWRFSPNSRSQACARCSPSVTHRAVLSVTDTRHPMNIELCSPRGEGMGSSWRVSSGHRGRSSPAKGRSTRCPPVWTQRPGRDVAGVKRRPAAPLLPPHE